MNRFFALTTLALAFGAATVLAQPKLEIVGGTTYDWGTITKVGQPLQAKIQLKNTGNQELNISDVKPGCGCTTAPLDKSKLAPGESTHVNVTLNIGSNNGQLMKSVTITSNSATNPTETLLLKAFIQRPLQPENTFLAYQQLFVGRQASVSTKIKNSTNAPIIISKATATAGMTLNIAAPTTIPANGEIELVVNITPTEAQKGYFYGQVSLQTNHPDQPTIDINTYGDVKSLANSPAMAPAGGSK